MLSKLEMAMILSDEGLSNQRCRDMLSIRILQEERRSIERAINVFYLGVYTEDEQSELRTELEEVDERIELINIRMDEDD